MSKFVIDGKPDYSSWGLTCSELLTFNGTDLGTTIVTEFLEWCEIEVLDSLQWNIVDPGLNMVIYVDNDNFTQDTARMSIDVKSAISSGISESVEHVVSHLVSGRDNDADWTLARLLAIRKEINELTTLVDRGVSDINEAIAAHAPIKP